ncbi:hypothetical protein E2C01_066039 [Portunus trituberculatus]|uniref:Uncharacterized protein n=1 Tax=Portunus trituberculatus TaxID=210409 RepID=A0A5B7HNQ4_PORTR|nr:hypothetical protein [Portunus trituberculatus]
MEEAKGTSTELMAASSRCLLLGDTWHKKGACMDTRETGIKGIDVPPIAKLCPSADMCMVLLLGPRLPKGHDDVRTHSQNALFLQVFLDRRQAINLFSVKQLAHFHNRDCSNQKTNNSGHFPDFTSPNHPLLR